MKQIKHCFLLLLAFLGLSSMTSSSSSSRVNEVVVEDFDVERYMGRWYEIARYDNFFERGLSHVIADYSRQNNGQIVVVNSGRKRNGNHSSSRGKARFASQHRNDCGALEVSFFWNFYSPYNILLLDDDYSYVLVSSGEDYLWILSRTPMLDDVVLSKILAEASIRGFDTSKLLYVEQGV